MSQCKEDRLRENNPKNPNGKARHADAVGQSAVYDREIEIDGRRSRLVGSRRE